MIDEYLKKGIKAIMTDNISKKLFNEYLTKKNNTS